MSRHIKHGWRREIKISAQFHRRYIPVLVESAWLRRQGAGQIDIAGVLGERGVVIEVKSEKGHVSKIQQKRLYRSCQILSFLLNRSFSWRSCSVL